MWACGLALQQFRLPAWLAACAEAEALLGTAGNVLVSSGRVSHMPYEGGRVAGTKYSHEAEPLSNSHALQAAIAGAG